MRRRLLCHGSRWWKISIFAMVVLPVIHSGCAHAQRPDTPIYIVSEDIRGVGNAVGTGGAGERDCQAEHEECFRQCWKKSRPPYPHKHDEWYYKRCTADCGKAFNDCVDAQEDSDESVKGLEFSTAEQAIEWIRNNKAKVMLGTVIVIASVAFVLTTGGSGALILVPLAI